MNFDQNDYVPPFDECHECRFFKRRGPTPQCKKCGAGEFFEEKTDDRELRELSFDNFTGDDYEE